MTGPRRILFIVFPGFQLLDLTGPLQMFASVRADVCGIDGYETAIAAEEVGAVRSAAGVVVHADHAVRDLDDAAIDAFDTVIAVGGGLAAIQDALAHGGPPAFLAHAAPRVRRIASVCSGAFLLAAAGALDGRRAATHWMAVEQLRRFRPAVEVDGDAIYVRDGPVWTSAGVTAGIDLALAMIEADHGRTAALAVARLNVVSRIRSGGQAQFSSDLAAQATEDRRAARLAEAVRAAPADDWRIERLTAVAGMSPRTLSRVFRAQFSASPAAFVERVRVDAARRALVETDRSIDWIARTCGFGGIRRMDRAFGRVLGVSPRAFRRRFAGGGEKETTQ